MSEKRQVALMFAPYAIGALLLFIAPALYSLSLSLYDADLLTESRFIGLGNFVELATTRSSTRCCGGRRCSC